MRGLKEGERVASDMEKARDAGRNQALLHVAGPPGDINRARGSSAHGIDRSHELTGIDLIG